MGANQSRELKLAYLPELGAILVNRCQAIIEGKTVPVRIPTYVSKAVGLRPYSKVFHAGVGASPDAIRILLEPAQASDGPEPDTNRFRSIMSEGGWLFAP